LTIPVRFHPIAVEEAEAAMRWYAERSERSAALFVEELEALLSRIAAHPAAFPGGEGGTRRALFRRFPYVIVFRESRGVIQIVAVAHGRRKPGFWRDRLT
jgi:plasmid stabilization system protein ParE